MNVNDLSMFLNSSRYMNFCSTLAIVCMFAALAISVFALFNYGRAQEPGADRTDGPPWVLLIATWRDSFLLSLLYVAENILFKSAGLQKSGGLETVATPVLYAPLVHQFGGLIIYVVIAVISSLRVIALSRWLSAQGKK